MATFNDWLAKIPMTVSEPASVLQVVAYNLRRAREYRGLTQAKLGEQITEITGNKWSAMTVGHAESGWRENPSRIRRFDANEITAFALVLRVPVTWFFLPPPVHPHGYPPGSRAEPWITVADEDPELALSAEALAAFAVAAASVLPDDDLYMPRLRQELPSFMPPARRRSDAKARKLIQRLREAIDEYEAED